MDYSKLHNRIEQMLKFESDDFLVNINLKEEISKKLLNYQFLHVFNIITALRSYNCVVDGSDTGTGKTYSSIAVCKQLELTPLIICPKIIISTWNNVCNYFGVKPLGVVNYEMIKTGKYYKIQNSIVETSNPVDFSYIKIDEDYNQIFKWNLPKNTIIIFDEVHKCKNPKSKNGKLLMSTKDTNNFVKILMLSATLSDTPKSFHIFGYMLDFYKSLKQANGWISGMLREDKNTLGNNNNSPGIYPPG